MIPVQRALFSVHDATGAVKVRAAPFTNDSKMVVNQSIVLRGVGTSRCEALMGRSKV